VQVVSDDILLPNNHIVAGLQILSDAATPVDDSARPNASTVANNQRVTVTAAWDVAQAHTIVNRRFSPQSHYLTIIFWFNNRLHFSLTSPQIVAVLV
jgi:hypothetical protein